MAVSIPFDRFLKFPELSETLEQLAAEFAELLEIESIDTTFEDREIWLCTVTNQATGPHLEKPAVWVDANIHATELTGSTAALHLIHKLVTGYGSDERITRALDTRCFYIVPRLSPDGAEAALGERPRNVRSSVRPYPRPEQQDGLVPEDMDGDGRILTMRVADPHGAWKPYADDPRLMVAREADEDGPGPFYRLLAEGRIQNFDGVTIKAAPALAGLDINRNYPFEWRPEGKQAGAGPYPTSEPEIRSTVQAIIDRPNIGAFIQYHTYSGVHLRPYSTQADTELPTLDLRVFKDIGEKATELTGYPAVSVFHDFRYNPKDVITGTSLDWAYDHLGVFAWATEFWNPFKAAGVEDYKFIEWGQKHPFDDDLKLLAYCDEELGGEGIVEWYEYEHPQLGTVELGGFDSAFWMRNPPRHLLEAEIAPHADWAIYHALISPLLVLHSTEVEALGAGAWRVRLVVANTGWLPTNITQKAVERKAVRPLLAEVVGGDGVEVVGERKLELGQLAGRALKRVLGAGMMDGTPDRAKAEWVVRAAAGATVELEARHPRAGVIRTTVTLE